MFIKQACTPVYMLYSLYMIVGMMIGPTYGFHVAIDQPATSYFAQRAKKGTSPPSVAVVLKMSIQDEVLSEMKVAMRAKDTSKLTTIRNIRAGFVNALKDGSIDGDVLPDEKAQDVLRKMAKMRKESIDMFTTGERYDLADAERAELAIISKWLPSLADEKQTRKWAEEVINKMGDQVNMGKVMGMLMKDHKAELDGQLTQKVVKELLQ